MHFKALLDLSKHQNLPTWLQFGCSSGRGIKRFIYSDRLTHTIWWQSVGGFEFDKTFIPDWSRYCNWTLSCMVTFSAKCLIKDCHCSADCTQSVCLLKTGQYKSHTHRSDGIYHWSHLWSFPPTLFFDQWKWVLYQIKDDEIGFKIRSELAF